MRWRTCPAPSPTARPRAPWLQLGTQPLTAAFTPNDTTDYMPATAHNSLTVDASQTGKSTPLVTWPTPVAIQYGTALNSVQLDATASVPGSFAYTPAAGTVLKAGTQTLTATFTPSETTTYSTTTATVQLTVNQATPAISWKPLAAVTRGAALTAAQLDATANVPGTFSYNPGAGYVPPGGTLQLAATFTPTDTTDYNSATAHNSLTIGSANTAKSTPSISWSAPAAISYGTALSSIQLNATANAPGSFAYTPAAGAVLKAGTQTLAATLTPSNTTTYSSTTATVQLTVNHATPAITWAPSRGHNPRGSPQRDAAGREGERARYVLIQPWRGQRTRSRHSANDSRVYSHRHHRLHLCHGAQ